MGLQAIPNDEKFAAAEMAAEIFEEGDEFGGADGAVDELEVDIPEGDARHGGELVPCEAVLQDRRLAFGCPGSNPVWPLAHTGLIYEDDGSALFGAVFFSVGHRFVFQWRMACSSRLMARPLGRWQEKFSPLSSRHGTTVWYVRRNGKRTRLRAEFGTPEFDAEYQTAMAGEPLKAKVPNAGTLTWLIDHYRETTAWQQFSLATRRQREYIFEQIISTAGNKPASAITAAAIKAGRDRRSKTPIQASRLISARSKGIGI